jgi:excisionase family DNA binding protein
MIAARCFTVQTVEDMTTQTPAPAPKRKPNRVQRLPVPDLSAVAFVKDAEAAEYLGLSTRSIYGLAKEGKLKRVYPRARAARITSESLRAYREAVDAGKAPPRWEQPANLYEQTPAPAPEPQKKQGLLSRWGLTGN